MAQVQKIENEPVSNSRDKISKGLIVGTYDFLRKIEAKSHKFTLDAAQLSKLREALWKQTGVDKVSKEKELANFFMNMAYLSAATTAVSLVVSASGAYQGLTPATQASGDLYKLAGNSIGSLNSTVFSDMKQSYATPHQSEISEYMNKMQATWAHKQTEDDSDKEKKSSNEQRLNDTIMQTLEKLASVYSTRG